MTLDDSALKKLIQYWEKGSTLDWQTSTEILNGTQRFSAALFYLHLSLEKSFKAKLVSRTKAHAPYTRNLLHLVEKLGWEVDDATLNILAQINDFNLEARYPDEKREFELKATKEFANEFLEKGRDILKWISQN